MSYGMIFSIILIAVFLVVAFFVIKNFLDIKKSVEETQLVEQLQDEIDRIWRSSQGEQNYKFERRFSRNKIEYLCFYDYEKNIQGGFKEIGKELLRVRNLGDNLYFYPTKYSNLQSAKIEHINMDALTMNPYCFRIENEFVEIRLSKNIGETVVSVS